MNPLNKNEFQSEFDDLKTISRNQHAKQNTYLNIVAKKKKSGGVIPFLTRFMLPGIAALVLVVLGLNFYPNLTNQTQNSAPTIEQNDILADFKPEEITKVYAAKSTNSDTMQAKMINGVPYLGTILFQPDERFHESLQTIMANSTPVDITPNSPQDIDMVIELKSAAPLKLNIWFNKNGQAYISQHNSRKIYQIKQEHLLPLLTSLQELLE